LEQVEAKVIAQRRKHKGYNSFYTLAAASAAAPLQSFKGQSRSISSDNERVNSSGGFLVSPYMSYLYAPTHAPQPPAFVASSVVESSLSIETVFGFTGTLPSMLAAVRDSSDFVCAPPCFYRTYDYFNIWADTLVGDCVLSCLTRPVTKKSSTVIRGQLPPSPCIPQPLYALPLKKAPPAESLFGAFQIAAFYPFSSPI
jgi:hypothetical protein